MLLRLIILLLPTLFLSGNQPKSSLKIEQSKAIKPSSSASQTLNLMFAGDIMSQKIQIESAKIGDNLYSYDHCFQYIKPILEQSDLAIGNLECTLSENPPFTGYPNFRSPDQLAEALKKNGFDVLVTANNHAIDGGLYGINHTIETIRKNGFVNTGTFKNAAYKNLLYPLIIYKNGFKIALINYTHHTNGLSTPAPSIVNRLDMDQVKKDIKKAKDMRPDVIIAFLHWGEEHQLDEDSNQRGLAHLMHQWGCHLVVGSHPHVVQPIKNETVTVGKETHQYLTAYSLGNFISSQPFINTEGGIVFEVNLKKENNQVSIENYSYIPVYRYTPYEQGKMRYYALPVSPYESVENKLGMSDLERSKMLKFAARVRAQLAAHGAEEHLFN